MARLATKQRDMLRQDGYVTAQEVADAVGLSLSAVHRGIEQGTIPGDTFDGHWFVDIRKYAGVIDKGPTIAKRVEKLVVLVGAPASRKKRAAT